uniref:RNA polymerase-associated protein LEO1 n=1 Tax=Meloidogyne hapla TaxID=6305 RepID=A0A1I8BCZ4_MELHA
MSDTSIESDEDVHEENVQPASQSNQQQHSDDSSSMSSTSSSDDEHDDQNIDVNSIHPQSDQQRYQEDDEASETNPEHQNDAEDGIAGDKNAEEEDDEDGIFTTKDDDETSGVHAMAEHNVEENDHHEEMEDDEVEHHDEEDAQEDVPSHQDEDETHQAIARMDVSDDEEQEEEVDAGPTKIELNMARCKVDLGAEGPYFVKLPNFLSIDTKPFDPETYDDEIEEDETLEDDGRTRLKLKLENTIRWRTVRDEQGNEKRESNAKIVRWSDGSMSLYLGNEIFEVDRQKIMDFNHLYIRQGAALQAQAVFGEKLVFRPHSTETLTHRKMTMNMAEKTSKTQKVRMLANVGDNPNAQRKEMIRLEEEKLRAAARREAQQRKVRERPMTVGLTSGFLEGYDSDEAVDSLAAIKRRYQHAPYGMDRYHRERSFSESDDEQEERQRKTINEAKIDSEEEEEGEEGLEEMETSDTEQRQKKQAQRPQQKRKIVIEEDED